MVPVKLKNCAKVQIAEMVLLSALPRQLLTYFLFLDNVEFPAQQVGGAVPEGHGHVRGVLQREPRPVHGGPHGLKALRGRGGKLQIRASWT